jgi:hypothetical protein
MLQQVHESKAMSDIKGGRSVLGCALVLRHVKSGTDDTLHGWNRSPAARSRTLRKIACSLTVYSLAVSLRTNRFLILENYTWYSICVEGFVRISEQRGTFALYMINCLVFITMVEWKVEQVTRCIVETGHLQLVSTESQTLRKSACSLNF